jgi:hypothetical protein
MKKSFANQRTTLREPAFPSFACPPLVFAVNSFKWFTRLAINAPVVAQSPNVTSLDPTRMVAPRIDFNGISQKARGA